MCGRAYQTFTAEELFFRYLNKQPVQLPLSITANYNMAPTHNSPVVWQSDGERHIDLMHWQFVPPWEPEFKTKLSTINAKSETVFTSRLYKSAILKQRCIIPVSGFIEWKKEGTIKKPFAIHLNPKSMKSIMSLAGIYGIWRSKEGEERMSFSIMTTAANDFMQDIHTRMPVVLPPEAEAMWLDPKNKDTAAIEKLLQPCPNSMLAAHEISTQVNSPRNNRPELIQPI